jgi:hypothetical protein
MNETKAPNPKLQAPKKRQVPIFKKRRATLGFDDWSFSGVWILGFGILRI